MLRQRKQLLCCSGKFLGSENAVPEMRGDEEAVMSSWVKEEQLMKWLECLEVQKGKIWAHNQRRWNQMQSYSMSAYLHWFKNSASSGKNLQGHLSAQSVSLRQRFHILCPSLYLQHTFLCVQMFMQHLTPMSGKDQREAQGCQSL